MDLARLRERTRGPLLEPSDAGYEEACTLWNARFERRPTAILRCRGTADVLAGVEEARESDVSFSVRSGGHHVSGSALADGGLTLDLRPMDSVRVDPDRERAWVGPGATWGDLDHETGAFGLAVPGGQDPNIGVAGLTLGGGVGWLSRKYGLTCDNLRAADVVTADGDLVRASESENEDLFWALRGGGGSFGVVTTFEFDLYPVAEVFAGSLVHPHDRAGTLARRYESFVEDAPREVRVLFGSMVLPAAPYFPETVHDTRVAICIACYAGDPAEGREVLEPLRAFGEPLFDSLRPRSYAEFQRAGESRGSMRTHLRSQYLDSLSADAIATVTEWADRAPSAGATVFVSPRSGAETDPPADATAYPHREEAHHVLVEARWDDPADDEEHVEWVESFHAALEPHTTGEAAANFVGSGEGTARQRAAYGGNYGRLVEVKRRWDPEGLFRATPALAPD